MLRILQVSRRFGSNLLRQELKDEGCVQTNQRQRTVSQFHFCFDGSLKCPQVFKELCPDTTLTQRIGSQWMTTSNLGGTFIQISRIHSQYEEHSTGKEIQSLFQALQYGLIIALSYSIVHDSNWFKDQLICPVLEIKERKSFQAQPLEETKSIVFQEVQEEINNSSDIYYKQHEAHILSDSTVEITSDYSSEASHSEDLDSVINMIQDLQKSIPKEIDILQAVEELKSGNLKAVDNLWKYASQSSSALFYLALAYDYGVTLAADQIKAEELYSKAASQGHLEAKYNLGVLKVERGQEEEGLLLIREAADNGIIEAIQTLQEYNQG